MDWFNSQMIDLPRFLQQLCNALLHFGSTLVGEGQCGNVLQFVATLLNQVRDLLFAIQLPLLTISPSVGFNVQNDKDDTIVNAASVRKA